ncbi:MAG: SAM-dependent methyltransferase [Candidatus Azotimanducaceae bacterium]|jgi:SAM-dependent methyltransferase
MSDNTEQAEFWNGRMGQAWAKAEAQIDRILAPLSDEAVSRMAAVSGEKVIDIGCGGGGTSLALTASGASIWGVDISQKMIECARQKVGSNEHLAFSVGDAAAESFSPEYQAVFSRFGVMFFADPISAFSNIRTALVPGGRMAFLCWQTPAENPWISLAASALQPFQADAPTPDPRAPGPFAFADPDYLREVLTAAGFGNIGIESVARQLHLGDSVAEAMTFQSQIGPLSRLLAELDDEAGKRATQAVVEALTPHCTDTGIDLGAATWLVTATNPD